jgi:hypothetical protein
MKILPLIAMTLVLTGCASASMNSSFSCGVGTGLGCKSVTEVNDIVDTGVMTVQGTDEEEKAVYSMLAYYDAYDKSAMPEREPEKRIRIWFAPHVNIYDNYVEETIVYSVIKEARWK